MMLRRIRTDADNDGVKKRECPTDDALMALGDWIKRTRKDRCALLHALDLMQCYEL